MDSWNIDQVWDALSRSFDHATVEEYRALSVNAPEAFLDAKRRFRLEIAELTPNDHDINKEGAKQHLILGHLILAVLDGLRRGVRMWRPFPHLEQLTWTQQETALLLWAAHHGTSDDHSVAN